MENRRSKIHLSLTESDMMLLKDIVTKRSPDNLNSLLELLVEKEDEDEYIRYNVYLALSDISGYSIDDFEDDTNLKSGLGLSLYHKKALKNYFQSIADDLGFSKVITVRECEELKKVSDCLTLVKSKK